MVGEEGVEGGLEGGLLEGGLVLVAVHDLEGLQQEQVTPSTSTLNLAPFIFQSASSPLHPAGDVRGRVDPEQRVATEPDDPAAWPGELQPGPALQPRHALAGGGAGARQVGLET